GFGRTRETSTPGIYNIVFNYFEEECGLYAAGAAVDIFLGLAYGDPIEELKGKLKLIVEKISEIKGEVCLGPSTLSIVNEAIGRNIPVIRLNKESLIQLGYGKNQRRIQAASTDSTSMIATELASDKQLTKKMLKEMGIPVAEGIIMSSINEIEWAIAAVGFPLVIKPFNSNQGKGISMNIRSLDDARDAFVEAKKFSDNVIVEKYLTGRDYRALIINYKIAAVAERIPANVTGNGINTIKELIEITNKDPLRGNGHQNNLTKIIVDEHTEKLLEKYQCTLDTILPKGEVLYLKAMANLSTGGTAIDRTEEIDPMNIFLLERAAKVIGLDIAGIDIITPDISKPLSENGGAIIEVNASPGLRMHLSPTKGKARNVASKIVDMLFPEGKKARIPIIAITGTNGKTTTTRLIAHVLKTSGLKVGYTTTDGIYYDGRLIEAGDNTGPISAQMVLRDPSVEVAVLETARGGILRAGLGFEKSDIGIVLNVAADHLGQRDINSVEEIARVKSVVANSVSKDGYVILNADDTLVYAMSKEVEGNVCLISMKTNNEHVKEHLEKGSVACIYENGYITIARGDIRIRVEKASNIPLSFGGRAGFMIQNILAATLALFLKDLDIKTIKTGLSSFIPSPETTPGRLNLIDMGRFSVLVDYAHNPAGFLGLHKFICRLPFAVRTGIFGGTGDRRDEDIRLLGSFSSRMFNKVIIKEDEDLRGRKPGEMTKLIVEGIKSRRPQLPIEEIRSEKEAVVHAMENAKEGEIIVVLCDNIAGVLKVVSQYRNSIMQTEAEEEVLLKSTNTSGQSNF
ncbi:MAG: cyanophycin synthetase, partial [Bacteroidota bacterium]|nr:cyanophycin synthetase [Bacteroidota bacterium]